MEEDRLARQIRFLVEIDKLKTVLRRAYLAADPNRLENDAEHSWHVAVLAVILAEYSECPVDPARLVRMLLVHDVVEIDAGDAVMYDAKAAVGKKEREEEAARRIFGLLPDGQRREMLALWNEFEEGTTPEAQLARAMDRLMPLLHNFHTQGKRWKEDGIVYEQVADLYRRTMTGCPGIREYALSLVEECVRRGYLPKGQTSR